jgi:hypothetical protein
MADERTDGSFAGGASDRGPAASGAAAPSGAASEAAVYEAMQRVEIINRGRRRANALRFFSTLCKVCASFFVLLGVVWLIVALVGGIRVNGAPGTAATFVAMLLGIIPVAAIPVAFFTLSALAEGVAELLEHHLVRGVRGS